MKFLKFAIILPMVLLLTSCMGEEPDNIAYVTALGIDNTEDGYIYTIQFANPTKISGGASEEGGSGGNIVENIAVEAATIYSAINNANSIVSKDLSLSHAKIIVVSEDVAREGLNGINDVFARNNDIRPDIYFAVAEDAGKYLEEVKPAIDLNPVKYYQLTYDSKTGNSIPHNKAVDFYTACISGEMDCALPTAGVAKTDDDKKSGTDAGSGGGDKDEKAEQNKSQKESEENEGGFENKTKNYYAGQAGEKIKNKSEVIGAAIFKGDRYVDKIGSIETELYGILMGRFKENNVTFKTDTDPGRPITVQVEEKRMPTYKIDLKNKSVKIKVQLDCELLSASIEHKKNMTISETEQSASGMVNEAAQKLIEKFYRGYGTDTLGICGRAKKQFITLSEYDKFKESFKPEEWSFEVNTDLRVKRTGMTYYY